MMLPKNIRQEAAKYAKGDNVKLESFIAGAMYATTGKYYKESVAFVEKPTGDKVVDTSFETFWLLYAKKRGRKRTEAKWNKLSLRDKIDCINAVPAYVASTPDAQYRCDPLTYLNGERWKDEILKPTNNEQQRTVKLASKAARILFDSNS